MYTGLPTLFAYSARAFTASSMVSSLCCLLAEKPPKGAEKGESSLPLRSPSTIPNLVYDESNVEDIDTTQEDHIYDECRYVLMENPISGAKHTQPPPMLDDPLDMDPRKDKTRFMRI